MKTRKGKMLVDCWRCSGNGRINAFGHIFEGICFRCKGEARVWVDTPEVADAKRIKREAKAKEKGDALAAECADLLAELEAEYKHLCWIDSTGREVWDYSKTTFRQQIARDFANQIRRGKRLSPKQLALWEKQKQETRKES